MPFPTSKSRGPKMSADAQPRHSVYTNLYSQCNANTAAAHERGTMYCAVLVQLFDDRYKYHLGFAVGLPCACTFGGVLEVVIYMVGMVRRTTGATGTARAGIATRFLRDVGQLLL